MNEPLKSPAMKPFPSVPAITPEPLTNWRRLILLLPLLIALPAMAANQKPVADAGPDRSVGLGVPVGLDGSRSHDTDGRVRKYRWHQTQGTKVKLIRPNTATAGFTSPAKSATLAFRLTVTDNRGASGSDTVLIAVAPPPRCTAPQVLRNGACVTPAPACTPPKVLGNGVCVTSTPVCVAPQELINGVCALPPSACVYPKVLENGACVTPPAGSLLNDTGLTRCGDGLFLVDCPLAALPGQDAETGRDATQNDGSDGHAGFSFAKLGPNGAQLPATATEWSCVRDNLTGLVWEVKTVDGGLHDQDTAYTNYSRSYDPAIRYGAADDAEGFVRAVNVQGLCGAHDWRLPTARELQGIADYSRPLPGPAIDAVFFPNTPGKPFWTASALARDAGKALAVYFDDGRIFGDSERDERFSVRLVRGGEREMSPLPAGGGVSSRFGISADGREITDVSTGLVWRRCPEGMAWDGQTCAGGPEFFMWHQALHRAEAVARSTGQGWRLPNVKELASLVETGAQGLAIDPAAFPGTPNDQFWSSSPYAQDAFYAWAVHTFYGSVYYTYLEDNGAVRLVRDAGP